MKLKYLFNTNAILVNDEKTSEVFDSYTFDFLGENIKWEALDQGKDITLEVDQHNQNYAKKIEKLFKLASVIVYRNRHVDKFQYVFSSNASRLGHVNCEAGIESGLLFRGNEDKFDKKIWSMLSFYLEARNSTSHYYKFICLYKIIEIQNLKTKIQNTKKILIEDNSGTDQYIESEVNNILARDEINNLNQDVQNSSIKQKSIGEYYRHLYRDAFAHTGFLVNNNYKHGYPTLSPGNFDDYLRYEHAVGLFNDLAIRTIRVNEPAV